MSRGMKRVRQITPGETPKSIKPAAFQGFSWNRWEMFLKPTGTEGTDG